MKKTVVLLYILSILAIPPGLNALEQDEIWPLPQWLADHPEEKEKAKAFSRRVSAQAIPLQKRPAKPLAIAIVYPALQESDYWMKNVKAFEARLKEMKIPYLLETFYSKPHEKDKQAWQIREALSFTPDYLILAFEAIRDMPMLEQILSRKHTRVILQNITTPLRRLGEKQPFLYVGFDHETGSQSLARYFQQRHTSPAQWALMLFTRGFVSEQRSKGFLSVIQRNSRFTLQEVYLTGGNREMAARGAAETLKNHPDLDFFYACSTDVALGVIDTLKKTEKSTTVMVNGWGGGEAELQSLKARQMDVTVMRMNDDAGVAMAEAIAMTLQNEQKAIPQVFSGKMKIIDKTSSLEQIKQLRKQAFRYSLYQNESKAAP